MAEGWNQPPDPQKHVSAERLCVKSLKGAISAYSYETQLESTESRHSI